MKTIRIILLLSMIFQWATLPAQPVQQYLHEGWNFRQVRGTNWYPATVPGVVHTDLLNNQLIDDPFYRLNERGVQWVDKEDWMYQTTFDVNPELLAKENILLHFEGLDTYADVTLNGEKLLSTDNMFREWKADVRRLLKQKGNLLQVYLHSPIKIAMPQWEALPFQYRSSNDQSENGGLMNRKVGVFVRKAGYHFGWDWGPRLVTSGIWRPVSLEAWSDARINDVHYTQTSVNAQQATMDVTVEVFADKELRAQIAVANRTDHRMERQQSIRLQKGLNKIPLSYILKKPKLWWTNGLGEPFLYDFAVTLHLNGKEADVKAQKIGIRSLKVVTVPDKDGESFYFELNGKPLFAKGANYIPCDNFLPRVTDAIYEKTIQDAVSANMNMLRVWGGGSYESDLFYDLCDKYGILVWQDFMFACSMFPAEGDWLENVRQEAIDNVRRLRNHSCIALWCGNNECLDAWFNWNWKATYDKQNPAYSEVMWKQFKDQYFVTLPKVVEEHHPGACYRKSSPYSDDMGTRNHTVGDMHYWEVWQGLKPLSEFNKERSRFFSEYGFQSFPEFESVKRYAPLPEDWELTSEVMMSHQRGGATANKRINDFLLSEYRQPKDFPSFIYMSQLLQADAMKMAMEAHRRDMPYCMGSLVWQHNDCWPVASWSSRDYYGRWKAQHYFTVKSFDDLLISPMEEKGVLKVFAVSDRLKKTSGTLTVRIIKLDGETIGQLSEKVSVPANTSTVVWEGEVKNLLRTATRESVVICITYQDKSGRTYTNNYFLAKHKDMHYPKTHITKEVTPVNGGYEVTLTSDVFARGVFLSLAGDTDHFISDNYMDLLPGERVKVKITTSLSPSSLAAKLHTSSFSDMYTENNTVAKGKVNAELALERAARQYLFMKDELKDPKTFPKTYDSHMQRFITSNSEWWCSGFYPGTLFYLYEETGNEELRKEGERMLKLLEPEQYNVNTHDVGFMMYCSYGNAERLVPQPGYKDILVNSAKSLCSRFSPTVGCIKSHNRKPDDYVVIIDNMMNLELLFWATQATGDSTYYHIAVTHADTTLKNHFRADNSLYHGLNYDPATGKIKHYQGGQGVSDKSAWSRGQAWGLYGYTLMYRFTQDRKYLDQAVKIAEFILNHPNMPKDLIPYWDFNAPGIPDALRDASAAAINCSGLLELCRYVPAGLGQKYFKAAEKMLQTLSSSEYTAAEGTNGGFILKHSVGNIPSGTEVDMPLTYADYYYVEALCRYKSFIDKP